HPADWGPVRPMVLRRAADPLAREVVLIPEPVAATLFYLTEGLPAVPPVAHGAALAVLDLGGGTVDASVVQPRIVQHGVGQPRAPGPGARGGDITILATRGDPTFGGADIDEALLEHVGAICSPADPVAWRTLAEGRDLADRRRRRALRADVRTAKETLSRHAYADVPLPPPFADVHVTRADLERLIAPALGAPMALLEAVLAEAGYGPGQAQPAGIFLVGGTSRIPLVARLVHERIGILPLTLEVPETVVARGALRCAPVSGATSVGGSSRTTNPRQEGLQRQPTPRRAHRTRRAWLLAGLIGVGVVGAGALLSDGPGEPELGQRVARYAYSFELLPGWEHAGGDDRLREVRLTPTGADGPEEVLVQENQLNYDVDADPARPRRELRAQLEDTRRNGTEPGRYAGFDPQASFAGRDVIHYRERPADGSTVDWYVLFQGRVQVSVGCRHTPAVARQVERACREVVRTLQIR
ncbi:MAG: type VII secretion-associated protein, partial [Pseudonocardiaceae bacterium]